MTITLRGTEVRHAKAPALAYRLIRALNRATRVSAVSDPLRRVALGLGLGAERITLVGNRIDLRKFRPPPRDEAQGDLELPPDVPVLCRVFDRRRTR